MVFLITKSNVTANNDGNTKLLERKRTWTTVKPTKGEVRSCAEETIKRALAIRHMELPVGEFITQGLEKEVPESARTLLESNVKDEIKHDLALGFIVESHGADPIAEMEAIRLRDAWIQHPDHTIAKALVAERAIFFVLLPMFVFLVMQLLEQYQLIFPETNRFTWRLIAWFVPSLVFVLALAWISFGRQLYLGYYNP